MKLLVTASTFPRRPGDTVPAFVLDQMVAMRRVYPDLQVHVLTPHDAGAARAEQMAGIAVTRFRYFWPESGQRLVYPAILPNLRARPWLLIQVPCLLVAETLALLSLARRLRPDAIYSHWFTPQALAGGLVAWLLQIPHVFTTHSADVEVLRRIPGLGPLLVRVITRRACACTAVSRRTCAKLASFFAPQEWAQIERKLAILPMGVDTESLAQGGAQARATARQALGLGGEFVCLFLGRLTEKKGVADLLAAVDKLRAGGLMVRVLIAGDGELRESLAAKAAALELGDQVQFLGYVAGDAKRRCLLAADALVVPSVVGRDGDAEGLPVALLEGLAAGKLCVGTPDSGADDVLEHGVNGFLTPAGDPEALAASLREVAELSPAARQRVQAAAQRRAGEFDWVEVAQSHYRHLLSGIATGSPAAAGQ